MIEDITGGEDAEMRMLLGTEHNMACYREMKAIFEQNYYWGKCVDSAELYQCRRYNLPCCLRSRIGNGFPSLQDRFPLFPDGAEKFLKL